MKEKLLKYRKLVLTEQTLEKCDETIMIGGTDIIVSIYLPKKN